MRKLVVCDLTLRDGNHALNHKLSLQDIQCYAQHIDKVGIDVLEVGHGNGLGASSLQLGESSHTDEEIIKTARSVLKSTKLGIHIIPGFGLINRELKMAIEEGVDVFRVACHCTEANITKRHIEYVNNAGREAFGVLMMSHMANKEALLSEALKMRDYGAQAIILMDSAGHYLPPDVKEKVGHLVKQLDIPIGFHAHNNLSFAVANTITAVEAGATIIDGTASGFGAGAGNAAIEVLVAVLKRLDYDLSVNLYKLFDVIEEAKQVFLKTLPQISIMNLVSGLHGVFSGFSKPVERAAEAFGVDPGEIFRILGQRKIIAGQEDLIIEVAKDLQISKELK